MFVHGADKLAEMQTKFHVIQAKLIMSVWHFTVQCNVLQQDIETVKHFKVKVYEMLWLSISLCNCRYLKIQSEKQ